MYCFQLFKQSGLSFVCPTKEKFQMMVQNIDVNIAQLITKNKFTWKPHCFLNQPLKENKEENWSLIADKVIFCQTFTTITTKNTKLMLKSNKFLFFAVLFYFVTFINFDYDYYNIINKYDSNFNAETFFYVKGRKGIVK